MGMDPGTTDIIATVTTTIFLPLLSIALAASDDSLKVILGKVAHLVGADNGVQDL